MSCVDELTLIAGTPIQYKGICKIRQPSLGDIRDIGLNGYHDILSMFLLSKDTVLKTLHIENSQELDEYSVFDLIGLIEELRGLLIGAFRFFLDSEVKWCEETGWNIGDTPVTTDELYDIRQIILKISCITDPAIEEKTPNFANKKAEEIWKKIHKGRAVAKASSNQKHDANMELPNLVAAVSAKHNSYNLFNIWGLTVYQLYDQFARIDIGVQLDICGTRWAAWGQDAFDTGIWFKRLNDKGEKK